MREFLPDMDLHRRVREVELLHVRVDGDEVDLRDPGIHHPVDRVQSASADTDDADDGEVRGGLATDVESWRAFRHRPHEPTRRRLVGRVRLRDRDSGHRTGRRHLWRVFDGRGGRVGLSHSGGDGIEVVNVLDGFLECGLLAATPLL